jgi:hypothetical protein
MADAAERHLEKIFAAERQRGVRAMCLVRLIASCCFAGLFFSRAATDARWEPLVLPMALVLVGASVLMVLAWRVPAATNVLTWSVAFYDVPLGAWINSLVLTIVAPRIAYPAMFALLVTQVAGSSVVLSRGAVVATSVATFAGGLWVAITGGGGLWDQSAFVVSMLSVGVIAVYTQWRTRELVISSRKDDLFGRYILGERIGAGGMAEVFKATYSPEGGFERPVAIKRVLTNLAANPHFIERFRREAELTARLVHPNVVQVLDFGKYRDTWFLAMEFVDGVPLNALVKLPLPLAAISSIGVQLCEALEFIHTRLGADGRPLGLVHRDLNPPNVLVSKRGEVKLADFGVARAADGAQLTHTGVLVGKLGYMPPEQLVGEPYDRRADLFALGVTLYELLTGARAYPGQSDAEVMNAVLKPLPRPSTLRPEVPPELDALVAELLVRDPARRPASALLVGQRLAALTGDAAPTPHGRQLLIEAVVTTQVCPPPLPVV